VIAVREIGVGSVLGEREHAVPSVFVDLVEEHWAGLVRLAALLLDGSEMAEDIVQEALIACLRSEGRLQDPQAALAYLRRAVVNTARSAVRRRVVALRHREKPMPDAASAEESAYAALERDAVVVALRKLPRRQREAVTLRYFSDLSEAQTAASMNCSVGAVKAYTSRGLAGLSVHMEGWR